MPIITLEIVQQDYEKKVKIARAFTKELNRITNIPKESVTVVFHELQYENLALGGELISEKFKKK